MTEIQKKYTKNILIVQRLLNKRQTIIEMSMHKKKTKYMLIQ